MEISTDYSVPKNEIKKVAKDSSSTMGDAGDFLKLFVAQMKNQDPMNPAGGTEFFSQTAQISMVEQLTKANAQTVKNNATLENLSRTLTATYLGMTVTAKPATGTEPVKGIVQDVSYDKDGNAILGLADGQKVALADVTAVGVK